MGTINPATSEHLQGVIEQTAGVFDFPSQGDLGWYEASIFQQPVGGAQFFRDMAVVIEHQRRTGAREILEVPLAHRLADALLGDFIDQHDVQPPASTSGRIIHSSDQASVASRSRHTTVPGV